ncbi:MAG: DUF883 domain-containing protein [Proteobacteria bacterium]|nr:DUF883 domain-containing protein [Pseudomonadota bacterium]
MESTNVAGIGSQGRNGARKIKEDLAERVRNVKDSATGEFKSFIDDVEEIVSRVADLNDPEVARLRDRLRDSMSSVKEALTDGADRVRQRAREVAGGTDDYVRENPWQALGIAALVGVAIGFLASRRS